MSVKGFLNAFVVAATLSMSPGNASAEAICKTITGYGQDTQLHRAADYARYELRRIAWSQFGVRPARSYRRLPTGMINYRFSCHESRKSGQTIHHCRASGTLCTAQGLGRQPMEPLLPRRL